MLFDLELLLDRLFGWVESDTADACFKWAVRIAYVAAVMMLLVGIGTIINIWRGIPS